MLLLVWASTCVGADAALAQSSAPAPIKIGGVTIAGYVQTDLRLTFDDEADENHDTFLIRRARVGLSGELTKTISYLVQGDLTDTRVMRDVYVTFSGIRHASIRAGQFIAPFGLERLTTTARLELIDRTIISDRLVPSRDLGVMVFSPRPLGGRVSYWGAVINGTGQNAQDNNDAKDVVGRVAFHVREVPGLTVAVNAASGAQPDGDRTRVGGDVNFDRGPLRASAEFVAQSIDDPEGNDAAGILLTGVWRLKPAQATPHFAGAELTARFVDVDDDADSLETKEIHVGGNYFVTPQVCVMTNWLVPIGDDQPHRGMRWWTRVQFIF